MVVSNISGGEAGGGEEEEKLGLRTSTLIFLFLILRSAPHESGKKCTRERVLSPTPSRRLSPPSAHFDRRCLF